MARLLLSVLLCLPTLLPAFYATLPRGARLASRGSTATMGADWAVAKKKIVVDSVVETMNDASLMFCVRSEGITVNDMNMMRQKFPDEVKIRCVKNTLVKRAAQEVPRFQGGDSLCTRSNYWFFVPEEHLRETFETWNDWVKETQMEDENGIVGGVFEGQLLDFKGIEAVTKLPTKQELMGQTAVLLKQIPTKLARALDGAGAQRLAKVTKQAAGQKLVQAVKAVEGKK
jgi:large subunit ribosomal protein L10